MTHDRAYRPGGQKLLKVQPQHDMTMTHDCAYRPGRAGGRKVLKVQLGEVVSMLQDMAAQPQAWQGRPRGSPGAAWLSFREVVSPGRLFAQQ